MRATPIYACQAENVGEVSFAITDLLTNIENSAEDGWLIGTVQRTSQRGLFPAVYTELTPESGDDILFLRKLQSEGLLSSTLQLEAFANGLDNGHVSTASRNFSSVTESTNNNSSVKTSENYSYLYTTSSDNCNNSSTVSSSLNHVSYSSSANQAPHVPVKPNLGRLAATEPTRALPPPIAAKPKFTALSPRTNTARTTSSQTMSPATSFSESLGSRTMSDPDSSRINSTDQETQRMREAEAARAWENAHLVKKPTTLNGSREVTRLLNGLGSTTRSTPASAPRISSPRPAVVSNNSEARSTAEQIDLDSERNAAASWEAKHGIGKSQSRNVSSTVNRTPPSVRVAHKPVVTSSPRSVTTSPRVVISNNPQPAVTTSPRVVISNSPQPAVTTSPRSVASNRPVVSSNPKPIPTRSTYAAPPAPPLPAKSFASSTSNNSATSLQSVSSQRSAQRSNPATENDAPALPHNASRSAVMDELLLKRKPVPSINPSTANDAPALPYSPARAAFTKPDPKPVEASVQPMPRKLISQINNQAPRSLSKSTNGFGDSFEPATQMALRPQHSSPAFPVKNATHSAVVGRPTPLAPSSSSSFQRSFTSSVTKSEESSTSTTATTSSIPLTYSREVKGALPFTTQSLQNQQLQHSYTKTSSSSSFTQHTSNISTGTSAIPSDALHRYSALFHTLNEQDGCHGYVSSNTVRDTVARSNLSDAQLRRIWQLADRNLNGQFGPGEFNILMHLVDCALRNDPIPDYLPVDLLHAAYV
ncbi:Intersectin-2 [Coemansia sp. RSA 678]|nr:Intersectin-2 [Coemansia sp. RSA 678]